MQKHQGKKPCHVVTLRSVDLDDKTVVEHRLGQWYKMFFKALSFSRTGDKCGIYRVLLEGDYLAKVSNSV